MRHWGKTLLSIVLVIFLFSFDDAPQFEDVPVRAAKSMHTDSAVLDIFDFAAAAGMPAVSAAKNTRLNPRYAAQNIALKQIGVGKDHETIDGITLRPNQRIALPVSERADSLWLRFFLPKKTAIAGLSIQSDAAFLQSKNVFGSQNFYEYEARFRAGDLLSIKNTTQDTIFLGKISVFARLKRQPKRLLWLVIDAMRTDVLDEKYASLVPNLHSFANKHEFYNNAITASNWTRPATLAFLTGKHVKNISQSYMAQNVTPDSAAKSFFYSNSQNALMARLYRRGFETLAFINNPFLDHKKAGYELGFSYKKAMVYNSKDESELSKSLIEYLNAHKNRDAVFFINTNTMHARYRADLANYLKAYAAEPLALPSSRQKYYATAGHADAMLSYLTRHLKKMNIYDDLPIIIHSDHGEYLRGDDAYFFADNKKAEFKQHGKFQMPQVFQVPLLIKGLNTAEDKNRRVSVIDLVPTLSDYFGLKKEIYDGKSLYEKDETRSYYLAGNMQFGKVWQDKYYESVGNRMMRFAGNIQKSVDVTPQEGLLRRVVELKFLAEAKFLRRYVVTNAKVTRSFGLDSLTTLGKSSEDMRVLYEIKSFPIQLEFSDSTVYSAKHREAVKPSTFLQFDVRDFAAFRLENHIGIPKQSFYTWIDFTGTISSKSAGIDKEFESQLREWGYIK